MKERRVFPFSSSSLETLAEEFPETTLLPPVGVVVIQRSPTIGKVPSMIAALIQRPAKGGSSPVLPFGKSSVCVSIIGEDEQSNVAKAAVGKDTSKALLSGAMRTRTAQNSTSSVVRRLFRQDHSMPGRQVACESTPLRRCISAGGATITTTNNANTSSQHISGGKSIRSDASKATSHASSAASCVRSSACSGADSSSSGSLEDALQSLTEAASTTASVLSSARQHHEEVLLRQREQFQLMMESMRVRSAASPGQATAPAGQPSLNNSIPACSPSSAVADAGSPSPYRSSSAQPPTSATETYRGVQFSMPLGCRIEDGEYAAEVLVTGPQIHVVLEFRDGGRNVLLVSSNCVCTVKRMGGRVLVNVLPPLGARSG